MSAFALSVSIIFSIVNISQVLSASALSGNQFSPGRIIDDAVFFNGNAMTALDVQGFLNAKVPQCDTNGLIATNHPNGSGGFYNRAQWGNLNGNPAPYTCLRDFVGVTPARSDPAGLCNNYPGGSLSAAQIINQVSISCGVSQKALIVLLEKEQSLITDEWPWAIQYRSATGYGCPDTAPCDQEYYGFFNQVYNAARQFKRYARDQSVFRYRPGRVNYVQYNPNAGCGGTDVYIENAATAGLYNYTPYQPNPAALGNLGGIGDNCSAYGNRNFWVLFNQWFGSTRFTSGIQPSSSSVYAKAACSINPLQTDEIGRLYNPDTQDFLYTSSTAEACQAISYGYIWDDVAFKNATGTGVIPVYRLVNYKGHYYTSDVTTKNTYLTERGYYDEGISFYAHSTNVANSFPVTRVSTEYTSLLTAASKEAEYYVSKYGYKDSGVAFYTPNLATDNRKSSVYRLHKNNQRLYTTSSIERNSAINNFGFNDEGTISTNDSRPNSFNTPVYRIRGLNGSYFYTADRNERDMAIINYGYQSEGIGFYQLLYSGVPIFRASNYYIGLKIYTNSSIEFDNAAIKYGFTRENIGWYSY